jgi:hypothetical protein
MLYARISWLVLVALAAAPSVVLAQPPATDVDLTLRIEGEDWTYWPHTAEDERGSACASPCVVDLPRGEVTLDMAAPTESSPQHRRTFDLEAPTTLRVGRWSHEGERIFGGVFLGVGGAASLAVVGVGAAFGSVGWMIMGPTGAGLLGLVLAIGIPFAAWSDAPTLAATRDRVVRVTSGPGDAGIGLAVSL